jgi:hypothetical protein
VVEILNREAGKFAKGYKGFFPAIVNGGGDAAGSKSCFAINLGLALEDNTARLWDLRTGQEL